MQMGLKSLKLILLFCYRTKILAILIRQIIQVNDAMN